MKIVRDILKFLFLYVGVPLIATNLGLQLYARWMEFQSVKEQQYYTDLTYTWSDREEAKYEQLLWEIFGQDFNALAYEEQTRIARDFMVYLCCKELGTMQVPELIICDIKKDGVRGEYSEYENRIRIDSDFFMDPNESVTEKLSVIAHECHHCYAHSAVAAMKELEASDRMLFSIISRQKYFRDIWNWRQDIENYSEIQADLLSYYLCDLETDARLFAEETVEKIVMQWESYYSYLDIEKIRKESEGAVFYKEYSMNEEMRLLPVTVLIAFVLGFGIFVWSKNRRFSLAVVLTFMATFCYRNVLIETQAWADAHNLLLYDIFRYIVAIALTFSFSTVVVKWVIMKEIEKKQVNVLIGLASIHLLLRCFCAPWYIGCCTVILFLLFWPTKKKKGKVLRRRMQYGSIFNRRFACKVRSA